MQFLHTRRERAGLLIIVLGVAITFAISSFAVGLLGAAVLYVLCAPVYRWLARRMRPDPAATLTLVFAILVIAIPVMWIVALVADQAPEMIRAAQNTDLFARIRTMRVGRFDVGAEVAKASGTFLRWLSQQAFDFVGGAARATLNLVISFFALYYMLVSAERTWATFRDVLPFSAGSAEELKERFYSVTHATVLGTGITAALQGGLVGLGFMLVGLPNALFWGVVTGFASILPVLGSALVWLPGVLVLALEQRYGSAIALLVIGAVLASNIDNVIRPLIFKRVSNIHPMITLVGAFAGVKFFGLLGVVLGPLAIQYFFEFVRLYRKEYVEPAAEPAAAPPVPPAAPA